MSDKFPTAFEFGPYRLSPSERVLSRDGEPVPLTPKAVDTLLVLVEHAGKIVTREQLTKAVWPDTYVGDDSLTRNISALRKVLSNGPPATIDTVPKRGYRFTGDVRAVAEDVGPRAVSPLDAHKTVAVLPFVTLGNSDEEVHLASGIADALISQLTKVPGLLVRPMTTILRYAASADDLAAVGRQLHVTMVLKGTVRRDHDQVRVSAQLVSIDQESVLWADRFSAPLTDLFAMEDAITSQVAAAMLPRVHRTVRAPGRRAVNADAYEAYVRGRHVWNRAIPDGYHAALEHYTQAVTADPDYALAHVGLADCHNMMGFWWVTPPRVAFPKAEACARRALELDDTLGEAYVALAWARLHFHYDREGAETLFKRGLELNPGYVTGHQWYALFFAQDGRFERAFDEIRVALAIDPLSMVVNYNLGVFFMLTRRYDEAIEQFQRTLAIDPTYFMAFAHTALSSAFKGDAAGAWAMNERMSVFASPVANLPTAALLHAVLGNREAAVDCLDQYARHPERPYTLPLMIGQVYAALGDADEAMTWIEEDYQERDNWLMWVKVNPCFDPIRHDPRFTALLVRIGLHQ